jgi:hypothetical protein
MKKYLTVVVELPSDNEAAQAVTKALPLFQNLHGGTITAIYAGDAITENELFEQRCSPAVLDEVRREAKVL